MCGERIGLVCVTRGRAWVEEPWERFDLGDGLTVLKHVKCDASTLRRRRRVRL